MTKKLMVGKVAVGGGAPVSIQSMCNTKTDDVAATVAQIHALEDAGCEIIRVAVPDEDAAKAVDKIKEQIDIPLIADIHFNYKLALMCAERGIDALRINPGNIGGEEKVKAVADICRQKNIPIRIGVNGGSLEKHILAKYGAPTPEAMVESALYHVRLLEKFDFNNIVISIKNSNVPRMMEAYRQLSAVTDYPLHVGVTEAGTYQMGLLKSGMGIGGMLLEGIGDTIRVSLAAEPEKEVEAGFNILRIGLLAYPGHVTLWNLALSALVFGLFQGMVFGKLVQRHTARIRGYGTERKWFWQFFDGKSFLIMVFMIAFGIGLRASGLAPEGFIAVFYTGLGASLLTAGLRFLLAVSRG